MQVDLEKMLERLVRIEEVVSSDIDKHPRLSAENYATVCTAICWVLCTKDQLECDEECECEDREAEK